MWEQVCGMLDECGTDVDKVSDRIRGCFGKYRVYPDSLYYSDGSFFFLAIVNECAKKLVVYREGKAYGRFSGQETGCGSGKAKICDLTVNNCNLIREIFPFMKPSSHRGKHTTIGLGDRLGIASAGHLRTLKSKNAFPVLAQQSIRELNMTGRNYIDVLAAASWAVFQEGYTSGFGADGDHLKTDDEVKMALDCGYTMITLDCSEQIDNSIPQLSQERIESLYSAVPIEERRRLESKYLSRRFEIGDGTFIEFDANGLKEITLIYLKAVRYTIGIYNSVILNCGRAIDFEMSIDETLTPTTPDSHYFVASELISGGVDITSLAPRFCGEFQKGIDYIGDVGQFTDEFDIHAKIARTLGYKISVHSGSDKFSIFPVVGEKTSGRYHLKTAGTNWLEAVRVIAGTDPCLYRRIHRFAMDNLAAARKYYHIGADPSNVPDIDAMGDDELPRLMDLNDSRQVFHITYGLILTAKKEDDSFLFRDDIYSLLDRHEDKYYQSLQRHLDRHLEALGI